MPTYLLVHTLQIFPHVAQQKQYLVFDLVQNDFLVVLVYVTLLLKCHEVLLIHFFLIYLTDQYISLQVSIFHAQQLVDLFNYFLQSGFEVSQISLIGQQILNEELDLIILYFFALILITLYALLHFLLGYITYHFDFVDSVIEYGVAEFLRIIIMVEKFVESFVLCKKVICH